MRRWLLLLGRGLLVAVVFCSLSLAAASEITSKVVRSLDSGKPVVLIVAPNATKADKQSEAYADWASYLNDFASDNHNRFTFITVKPAQITQVFLSSTPIKHSFAVVFLKSNHEALYYDGMILDPATYKYGSDYLAGRESTIDKSARTLRPFTFKLIGQQTELHVSSLRLVKASLGPISCATRVFTL